MAQSPEPQPRGHTVRDETGGLVMRVLNETDEVPKKIVKVIGDMCGDTHLHRDCWDGAVRSAALKKAKRVTQIEEGGSRPTWRIAFAIE